MVLRALGGTDAVARRLVDDTFVQAWLRWRQVRELPEPLSWARWTAVSTFTRTATSATAVDEEPVTEAGVLIKALAKLPGPQRRAVVLHYMADVSVTELARFAGRRAEHIEVLLDEGFDTLVELFDWPKLRAESEQDSADGRYYWTADVLSEVGRSLAEAAVAPAAGRVIRRAELQRWKGRAVPVMGAAAGVAAILVAPLLLQQPASLGSTLPESSYTYVDPPDSTPGSGARVPARKPLPATPATAVFGAAVRTDIDPAFAGPTFVPALASAPAPSANPAWQGPVAVAATGGSAAAAAGPGCRSGRAGSGRWNSIGRRLGRGRRSGGRDDPERHDSPRNQPTPPATSRLPRRDDSPFPRPRPLRPSHHRAPHHDHRAARHHRAAHHHNRAAHHDNRAAHHHHHDQPGRDHLGNHDDRGDEHHHDDHHGDQYRRDARPRRRARPRTTTTNSRQRTAPPTGRVDSALRRPHEIPDRPHQRRRLGGHADEHPEREHPGERHRLAQQQGHPEHRVPVVRPQEEPLERADRAHRQRGGQHRRDQGPGQVTERDVDHAAGQQQRQQADGQRVERDRQPDPDQAEREQGDQQPDPEHHAGQRQPVRAAGAGRSP